MSLCLYLHVQKVDVLFTIKGYDLFDNFHMVYSQCEEILDILTYFKRDAHLVGCTREHYTHHKKFAIFLMFA